MTSAGLERERAAAARGTGAATVDPVLGLAVCGTLLGRGATSEGFWRRLGNSSLRKVAVGKGAAPTDSDTRLAMGRPLTGDGWATRIVGLGRVRVGDGLRFSVAIRDRLFDRTSPEGRILPIMDLPSAKFLSCLHVLIVINLPAQIQ